MDWRKIILVFAALCCVSLARAEGYTVEQIPDVQLRDSRRFVSNPDGVLSAETVRRMDAVCASLRDRGYAQVAVVAVEEIEGEDLYSFAIELFEKWGVGGKKSDNGLGILLVRGRREIRFVTGQGIEGVLPDIVCKRIQMNYMVPSFRQGDYDTGMLRGLQAVAKLLEGGEIDPDRSRRERDAVPWWTIFIFLGGFYLVGWFGERKKKTCPKCHRVGLKLNGTNEYIINNHRVTEYTYVCRHCGQRVVKRINSARDDDDFHGGWGGPFIGGLGGWGGLGGGGGSFGGGFGGGSFGGGGAGSKW